MCKRATGFSSDTASIAPSQESPAPFRVKINFLHCLRASVLFFFFCCLFARKGTRPRFHHLYVGPQRKYKEKGAAVWLCITADISADTALCLSSKTSLHLPLRHARARTHTNTQSERQRQRERKDFKFTFLLFLLVLPMWL